MIHCVKLFTVCMSYSTFMAIAAYIVAIFFFQIKILLISHLLVLSIFVVEVFSVDNMCHILFIFASVVTRWWIFPDLIKCHHVFITILASDYNWNILHCWLYLIWVLGWFSLYFINYNLSLNCNLLIKISY